MSDIQSATDEVVIRQLGLAEYQPVWDAMRAFTDARDEQTPDELWWLEHPPIFTQGQAGKAEHLLATGDIPVIQVDRGGQVTYHGPGQLVGYLLIDLRRRDLGVRELVTHVESAIVEVLEQYGIAAAPRADAPGVYLLQNGRPGAKLAQLGLRVRRGCTFHGLSLNVDMDMEPFARINPCGHPGLAVTSMRRLGVTPPDMETLSLQLADSLCRRLGYTARHQAHGLPALSPISSASTAHE